MNKNDNMLEKLQKIDENAQDIKDMCRALTNAITAGNNYNIKPSEIAPKTIYMKNGKEIEIPESFIKKAKGFKFKKLIGTEHFYVNSMAFIDMATTLFMSNNFNFIIPKVDEHCIQFLVTVDKEMFVNIDRADVVGRVQSVLHRLMPCYSKYILSTRVVPVSTEKYEYFQVTYNLGEGCITLNELAVHKVLYYLDREQIGPLYNFYNVNVIANYVF